MERRKIDLSHIPNVPPEQSVLARRKVLVSDLNAREQQNPSPLVANVIEHRERTMLTNAINLQAYIQQAKKQDEEKAAAAQAQAQAAGKPKPAEKAPPPSLRDRLLTALQAITRGAYRKKVPVLLQMSAVECSATCIAMILRYYGRKASISEVSERAGVGRDGLTALGIVKTARSYGMRVRAISMQDANFRHVTMPCIVHWQFNHFIVVERWLPSGVDVVDPAEGRRHMTTEEFDAGFTGIAIMMEPGVQFVRHLGAPQITIGTYAAQYIRRAPMVLIQIILTSLLLQAFGLSIPLLTKVVIDQIIPNGSLSPAGGDSAIGILTILGIGMIIVLLAQGVTTILRASLLTYLQTRIDTYMMTGFFEHLLSLPKAFFDKRSSGDILTRLSSNVVVRDIISNQLVSTFLDGSLVIVYLVILLLTAPLFAAIVVSIGFLQIVILLSTNGTIRNLSRRGLEASGKTQGYSAEVLSGIATLKAGGAEQRALQHWSNLFFEQLNTSIRQSYYGAAVATILNTLRALSPLGLLWVGSILVIKSNGTFGIGTMLALNTLAAQFLSPLSSLVGSGQALQTVNSHMERIADVLDAQPEQDIQRVQQPPRLSGHIRLDGISFQYDSNSPMILKNISLTIPPGKKIAIVGRSGSGKSTLGRLLLGLCLPTQGEIYYDGIPLRFLNYQSVRAQFGVVMQDATIFSGSVRQNIAFNSPDLSMDRITMAAQMADIHDDIMAMSMGYETFISEGGSVISGGQRQRLAIARALAASPSILLMDEATSALDVVTERKVEENLRRVGCTQIIIAHRLSTVRNADLILVLNEGMLLEQGTHDQLLQQNRYYAKLIRAQLASGEIKGQ